MEKGITSWKFRLGKFNLILAYNDSEQPPLQMAGGYLNWLFKLEAGINRWGAGGGHGVGQV